MKVKALLKVLKNTEYNLVSTSGKSYEHDYVGEMYGGISSYEDWKVVRISTLKNCDTLFIVIKKENNR